MQIAYRAIGLNQVRTHSFDGWIVLAYVAFAAVVLLAAYAASSEPGLSAGDLFTMTALP